MHYHLHEYIKCAIKVRLKVNSRKFFELNLASFNSKMAISLKSYITF